MYGTFRNGIRECLKTFQKHFCDLAIKDAFVPETCYMGIIGVVMGSRGEKDKRKLEESIFTVKTCT